MRTWNTSGAWPMKSTKRKNKPESLTSINQWIPRKTKIAELIPYERNPRKITRDRLNKLKERIKEQGYRNPICIDEKGVVLAGHQRLKALIDLGLGDTEIIVMCPPPEIVPLTAALKKQIVASDNISWGEFDFDILQEDYTEEELTNWGFENISFEDSNKKIEEDEVPAIASTAITMPGDIWILGKHRVMCGDSTKIEDVDKLMGGAMVDLFLTDPPYNVSYVGKTKDALTIKNDKLSDSGFFQFLSDAFACANKYLKPGGVFYIWHADSEGYNFRGACKHINWVVRQCLVWCKQTMVLGRQDYHWRHEPCLYGWKDGAAHNWYSDRKQTTVLEFDRPMVNKEHPTMKPVTLLAYQIENSTKDGDRVLDLFLGSGSTLIAADQLNRECYGMELDPKYCDVIVKRWEALTNQHAISLTTGKKFKEYKTETKQ